MDLNLNLIYSSGESYGNVIDDRVNVGYNWQYNFSFLMTKDGGNINAVKEGSSVSMPSSEIPMFFVTSDGTKYPIDMDKDSSSDTRKVTHCGSDYITLKYDYDESNE